MTSTTIFIIEKVVV